ncbi:hypothetical protein P2G88_04930 [Aliiglaciecola sp. CAU 1673]|uniref:hypothetical protein n=1 Tax=Aliiglaciecola sp. CAU 1673 TaxID=3032595 RepID=UPI0023D9AD25|nr:hypothetical protein [Aliiglaciecola sp. CAU 1673]MDF2177589.1 hypothetical protein [Aliiglaciecola sp. CAU 1673]
MSKLDKDQVVAQFTEAYKAAHGKAPQIEAKGGWYSVDGGKNLRLAQLEEMIAELGGAKAAPAKAEKKAKPAAAKPAKAAKKKSGGSFSVKAYWAEQLAERGQSGRQPR